MAADVPDYLVHRGRARKVWWPRSGWRWPPPRLLQFGRIAGCSVRGHDWSSWSIDDMDGPGEYMTDDPDSFMPYCSRDSRPGEFGSRVCRRCSAIETRWPAGAAPTWFEGHRVMGEG